VVVVVSPPRQAAFKEFAEKQSKAKAAFSFAVDLVLAGLATKKN
jgi:hypothetical protein